MTRTDQRAALYARVSTLDQEPENQLAELRRYVEARGWSVVEYVDHGVSGAKDRRPALDQLLKDAKRRKLDVLVCWRLDRLGRNLRHLILLLDELQALGVAFVSLAEGIDATTPAGRFSSMSSRRLLSLNGRGLPSGSGPGWLAPKPTARAWDAHGSGCRETNSPPSPTCLAERLPCGLASPSPPSSAGGGWRDRLER